MPTNYEQAMISLQGMADFLANICKKKPTNQLQPNDVFSATRKFDSKAANLLLKIAQKEPPSKTGLNQV